eukprot:10882478-Ditylum_brightwellii.AAC.1
MGVFLKRLVKLHHRCESHIPCVKEFPIDIKGKNPLLPLLAFAFMITPNGTKDCKMIIAMENTDNLSSSSTQVSALFLSELGIGMDAVNKLDVIPVSSMGC